VNGSVKKNKYIIVASLLMVALMALAIYFITYDVALFYGLLFGLFIGFFLQRSRFCFASGFRDIFLIRNGSMTRALLFMLFINSIGFFLLHVTGNINLFQAGALQPVGLNTIIGGLLFGFGLILAGSCVSGCLMRMGEGYIGQWVVFVGIMVGSYLPSLDLDSLSPFSPHAGNLIFIPDYLGWLWTIIIYVVVFVFLHCLISIYEGVTVKKIIPPHPGRSFKKILVGKAINYYYGAFFLALLHIIIIFSWGRTVSLINGISGFSAWLVDQFNRLTPYWSDHPGWSSQDVVSGAWLNPILYFAVALIIGAAVASLINSEFRLRFPKKPITYLYSLGGGLLLGFSSNMAVGCNFGAFWSGISSFSLQGWVFGLFILIGSFLGGKIYIRFLIH